MTDLQLDILVAIPLVGILANTGLFIHLSGRVDQMSNRMDGRIDWLRADMDSLRTHMDERFDTLTGKVIEIDNRLTRVEDRIGLRS